MICPHCKREFKDEGRAKGGRVSKREITPEQQKKMQLARLKAMNKKKRQAKSSKKK